MKVKLFLILLLLGTNSWAQTSNQKANLEAEKEKVLKEISTFKTLLQAEKKKEKSVLTEIQDKNQKIKLTEKLINVNETQAKYISNDIYKNQITVNSLSKELETLKADYAKMIVKAYKSRSEQSRIMFVLSSQNFYQAYKRIQYMKQYASFRKAQADEIVLKQKQLTQAIEVLQGKKKEKESIVSQTEAEKQALEKERLEKEKLVKVIQKDKKKYTAEIDKKEKERKNLDKKIKQTIADEIAKANKKNAAKTPVKTDGKTTTKTTKPAESSPKYILSEEGKVISNNFKENKGKLPSPIDGKGYISSSFGYHKHPTEKNLDIYNSGIEITTDAGTNARAIFGGEVIQIQVMPGTNKKIVYIRHGDYFTVYQNLSSVSVKVGDKVSIKQTIGKIYTNAEGKTILKFLVQQNTTTLNPQSWLSM